MQLRAHGIALVGTVEDDPGDPTFPFDLDRFVFLVSHSLLSSLVHKKPMIRRDARRRGELLPHPAPPCHCSLGGEKKKNLTGGPQPPIGGAAGTARTAAPGGQPPPSTAPQTGP